MHQAFIYDAVRTPRGKGKPDGSLYDVKPIDLVVTLLRAIEDRNHLDTAVIGDVILGCVTQIGEQGACIARTAALYAGWNVHVPGLTLNRFCASGLEAVNLAAMTLQSGMHEAVVAGGVESMSRVKMGSDGGAWVLDPMVNDALGFVPQGISADLLATLEGFSRLELDEYAVTSHRRAAHARDHGYFARSLIPVVDLNGTTVLDRDETIRDETSVEDLAGLKPAFELPGNLGFDAVALSKYRGLERIEHVHHAGNSSGIVDGSALLLLGSAEFGERFDLQPRAKIVSCAVLGEDPTLMLVGPGPASKIAMTRAGMTVRDIDLFEVNEAFSAVVLRTIRELDLPADRVNVNGGAIAMGHPLGATGAVILNTLLDELERRDLELGLATLCAGGGMGIATIIQRV